MLTRRSLIHTTALLALATALPAAETHPTVTLRITWLDQGRVAQVDYQEVPAVPAPEAGRMAFGQGVECLVEVMP